ncbi:(2Fe-2S)-binding protein [Serinicoccus kebangsaanensis]|uniref:(2Fe-2S)-binding protein n=1 Tax=Serinicoccus kebangsaanensis TaxID=2602069 RepID=UPI00124D00B1|nr:(2Fe-2S)-binding protein [Serinicoccus kebangsaanensis]
MSARAPEGLLPTLGDLGGFFEVTDPTVRDSDAVAWTDALAPDALTARVATIRAALGRATGQTAEDVDVRVAVSALQVGLASRLWSVALAGAVLHDWVPDLTSANLVASPVHAGRVPLGLVDPGAGYAVTGLPEITDRVAGTVVDDSLAALEAACTQVGRTSAQVLRSNSASSLVGAARVLAGARPSSGPRAWEVVRRLLEVPALARGGGVRERSGLPAGTGGGMEHHAEAFLRRGCCLYDRLPGHGLCPDCVRAVRRPDLVTPGH